MQHRADDWRFYPDEFFTAAQQSRLSFLMEHFRAAHNAGQAMLHTEYKELQNLIETELQGANSRAQFLLDRRDEIAEFAELLRKHYPNAFIKVDFFGPRRTELAFSAGESKQLIVMEYEAMEGYGISRVKSAAEGWLRDSDFFFPDFGPAKQCLLSQIETYGLCETE